MLSELSEAARQAGVDFSWNDHVNLSVTRVELNPEDAMETGERLAEAIFKYLELLVRMDEMVRAYDAAA